MTTKKINFTNSQWDQVRITLLGNKKVSISMPLDKSIPPKVIEFDGDLDKLIHYADAITTKTGYAIVDEDEDTPPLVVGICRPIELSVKVREWLGRGGFANYVLHKLTEDSITLFSSTQTVNLSIKQCDLFTSSKPSDLPF